MMPEKGGRDGGRLACPVALLSRECCARGKKRQVQADATDDTRRVVERLTGLPYERCWR